MNNFRHHPLAGAVLAASLGLLLLARAADTAPAGDFTGTWTWTFTMPDGSTVKPQVQLKQEGANLTGTSRFRAGTETAITNGKVEGNQASFEVVRELNGRKVLTRYTGRRAGGRLKGQIESNWSGEPQTYDWEAVNATASIEGKWEWPVGRRTRRVELQLEGSQLKGKLVLEDGQEFPLRHTSFKAGEFAFEAQRERDGQPYTNLFRGKLEENVLKGKLERIFDGQSTTDQWEAKRAK
jgi:hypothetical protein